MTFKKKNCRRKIRLLINANKTPLIWKNSYKNNFKNSKQRIIKCYKKETIRKNKLLSFIDKLIK